MVYIKVMLVARLMTEKEEMEDRNVEVDGSRMQQKLELCEEEIQQLREENHELADRYVQVKRHYSDLFKICQASNRLHSTLSYTEVIETIKEIVINMIFTEVFGIYLVDEREDRLLMITHEGLAGRVQQQVPIGKGVLRKTIESGEVFIAQDLQEAARREGVDEPIACIPLKVGKRVVGVIAIHELLPRKNGFQTLDVELFELLREHAAIAIYAARLYAMFEHKRGALEGFMELFKTQ